MDFEWDPLKAEANLRKHDVPFTFAIRAFDDPARQERADVSQDYGEERWVLLGRVGQAVLYVVFTQRHERIRIISARKATRNERQLYWDGRDSL